MTRSALLAAAAFALVAASPRAALALDKQGSAHGGSVDEAATGFGVSGSLILGVALVNPTYAARPDNSGIALFRYAAHADIDVLGPRLSFPLDVNLFTDRKRRGGLVFAPTEFDAIGGVTTTNPLGPGDIELGARVENDRPVDRTGLVQSYVDVRARYLYSLAHVFPNLGDALVDGDISGYATAGYFAFNPTYAARPDNSGLALFRYVAHAELSIWHDHWSVGLDGTFFTDRQSSDVVRPSELDLTYEVIGRAAPFEVHVAYERDMPVDRGGLVQSFLYALFVFDFDTRNDKTRPMEERGTILSP